LGRANLVLYDNLGDAATCTTKQLVGYPSILHVFNFTYFRSITL
jgi:hypothetical protein